MQSELNPKDRFTTNAVIMSKGPTEDIYFLPAYIRMKCKGFHNIDIKNIEGTMTTMIMITIFYGSLDAEIVEILKKKAVIEVGRADPIRLEECLFISFRENKTEKTLNYTIRKSFKCRMDPRIFWTPF